MEQTSIFNKDNAVDMAKRLLIDSIWKSANLEGLGTTFPKTEAILLNVPTTTNKDELLFIINMKRAWQFLLDNLNYTNNLILLREFNKIVGELLISNAGEIRKFNVSIGGTDWQFELPQEGILIDKINSINNIINIEDRTLEYFCFVARTQMFADGNKRVAQLIANKILIENNIGILQIPIKKIEEFKTLLIQFYETNNNSHIKSFISQYCIKRV